MEEWGAGPFHSQSNESWFTQVPGLKVVYPSNPRDAKGLLIQSIDDPNPVIFLSIRDYIEAPKEWFMMDYIRSRLGKVR